jgi:hypothetical protein
LFTQQAGLPANTHLSLSLSDALARLALPSVSRGLPLAPLALSLATPRPLPCYRRAQRTPRRHWNPGSATTVRVAPSPPMPPTPCRHRALCRRRRHCSIWRRCFVRPHAPAHPRPRVRGSELRSPCADWLSSRLAIIVGFSRGAIRLVTSASGFGHPHVRDFVVTKSAKKICFCPVAERTSLPLCVSCARRCRAFEPRQIPRFWLPNPNSRVKQKPFFLCSLALCVAA